MLQGGPIASNSSVDLIGFENDANDSGVLAEGPAPTLCQHLFTAESCKVRFFLDIFSGASMPVSAACKLLQIDFLEPVDLIHGHDVLDHDKFHSLLALAESGFVGAALAAPYFSSTAVLRWRRPGPLTVRTPSFLDGGPSNSVDQQLAVQESSIIHDRQNGLVILENPASSMTWLGDLMHHWVHTVAPFAAHASACNFGTDWAKTWCFVANKPQIASVAQSCNHPPGSHESVVGVRLPDGTFKSRLAAEYPKPLADALASIIVEFTTHAGQVQLLADWPTLLPENLQWPDYSYRIDAQFSSLHRTCWHSCEEGSSCQMLSTLGRLT